MVKIMMVSPYGLVPTPVYLKYTGRYYIKTSSGKYINITLRELRYKIHYPSLFYYRTRLAKKMLGIKINDRDT